MKRSIPLAAVGLATALAAPGAAAVEIDHEGPVRALVENGLRAQVTTEAILAAVRVQNAKHAGLGQADIDAMDAQWRAEVESGGGPLTESVLGAATSEQLRAVQAAHQGMVTELFVMDDRGLVVGESDLTSDYWQGDESKWKKTYGDGAEAIFVDEVEMDESTQTLQSQVSFTLVDPATGEAVGAVTAGVNVEMLFQ